MDVARFLRFWIHVVGILEIVAVRFGCLLARGRMRAGKPA